MRELFDMPLEDAANYLGISKKLLKKRYRQRGIERWPYRKLNSLKLLKDSIYEEHHAEIDEEIERIKRDPNSDICSEIRYLMTGVYKERYKNCLSSEDTAESSEDQLHCSETLSIEDPLVLEDHPVLDSSEDDNEFLEFLKLLEPEEPDILGDHLLDCLDPGELLYI